MTAFRIVAACALVAGLLVPAAHAGRADPADASAPAPPVLHHSVLSAYRSAEHRVGDWREVNERVARAGGWRAYLKEAQRADTVPPTPASAAPPASTGSAPTPSQPRR